MSFDGEFLGRRCGLQKSIEAFIDEKKKGDAIG
jgi:hypothetical protein